ncbi:MAG: helix-turn-helix transcriptional regulator [Lentisphaeria bacterium]|nr:helix-turn-helix transcriptional regulator [Lentisphaeria bacterium]
MEREYFKKRIREKTFWREEAYLNTSTGANPLDTLHLHHIAKVVCRNGETITFPLVPGPNWSFLLCSADESTCELYGEKRKLSPSHLLVLSPSTFYPDYRKTAGNITVESSGNTGNCVRYYFALERNIFIEQMFHLEKMRILSLAEPEKIYKCMEELFTFVQKNNGCESRELSILLFRFLTLITAGKKFLQDFSTYERLLEQVRRYPGEYYSLQVLQNTFKVSRNTLCRIFQERTSMSPMQFVMKARLENSCWMLTNSTLPIHEIAELNGYRNAAFYSAAFKKLYGISPARFRKMGNGFDEE